MIPILHVYLLGDFRLVYGDVPMTTVNTSRLQALLAYLVLHGHAPQSRRRLAFLLWPNSVEGQAHTNLRTLFHRLRRALPTPDHFLHAEAQTLQWRVDSSFTLDVADFVNGVSSAKSSTHLRQALAFYTGDLLPDFYDDWVIPERERLRQIFGEALEQLILMLEREHDYLTAVHYARRLLQHDALHEAAYRYLMQLHALSGDRAEALRVYQICEAVLKRELNVEPSPATRQLYARLQNEGQRNGEILE